MSVPTLVLGSFEYHEEAMLLHEMETEGASQF